MIEMNEALDKQRAAMAALEAEMVRETATTPKELIHARGTLRLYHYLPQTADVYRVPLLIVMSIVSKPYIFDLTPGQSFIEFLVRAGFDVYLIDWGTPRAEHKSIKVDDYVADLLPECIEQVARHSGERDVTLIGYCLGGIFTALYAAREQRDRRRAREARRGARGDAGGVSGGHGRGHGRGNRGMQDAAGGSLANLVFLATPINGHGMELQRTLLVSEGLDPDLIVDTLGNVPPSMIEGAFQMLRPLQKASGQAALLNNVSDPEFVKAHQRIVRWGADALPFPGEAFRQLARDFVLNNRIVDGTFEIRGEKCDLGEIEVPVLHVMAEHDHVVPAAASRDLVRLVGSTDKEEMIIKGGHVSLVAGVGAVMRTWPRLVDWMAPRSL